jgi:flavin-binding protein dodecin
MRDHVRFHSIEFTPPDTEPGQVNTERYGYALATWVAARLQERGFTADGPVPEDWGWLLAVAQDGSVVRIGCGNVEGSVSEWLVFLDVARPGLLARLMGRAKNSVPNAAYGVIAAIHGALQASQRVEDIEWFRVGPRGQELDHASTPI